MVLYKKNVLGFEIGVDEVEIVQNYGQELEADRRERGG